MPKLCDVTSTDIFLSDFGPDVTSRSCDICRILVEHQLLVLIEKCDINIDFCLWSIANGRDKKVSAACATVVMKTVFYKAFVLSIALNPNFLTRFDCYCVAKIIQ